MTSIPFHKKFISTVAAVSIALTAFSAAPARAGDDDVAKVLGALVGLAVLGAIINDKRHDAEAQHQPRPRVHNPRRPYTNPAPRPLPRRFVLPNRCLRTVPLRNGKRINAFGQGCLNNHYRHVNSLPRHCARADRSKNRVIHSYGARCLQKAGYKLARH
ncbi:hypothetical protein [Ascidiaceihabitans sp.]|uniref:hypothetical protein n=1 Tax=Ascidiaceihabitans sp. TaxID=1872644 RepID=UPI0032982956